MLRIFKILGLISIVLLGMEQSLAQDSRIEKYDSLIKLAETDTARISLIVKKLVVLSTLNLDSAIHLAETTLDEAQKIKYYKGVIDLRTSLVTNYSFKGNFEAGRQQLKLLEQTIVADDDSSGFAGLYASTGLFYGVQSKYDSSIYYYERAVAISERVDDKANLGTYYSNVAIGYQQQSNFPMALHYQQKSLKLYQELGGNESGQAYTLVNMANTYNNMQDYDRAESTFLEALELCKKVKLNNVELYAYSNLATLYIDEERWQDSYEYAMKAANLGASLGDNGIESASLSKASTALVNMNQADKALALSKKAIAVADSSKVPLNIYQAYSSMGYALMSQGAFEEAIPFYEKGIEAMKDADIYSIQIGKMTKELSECYEKAGNPVKALELYKKSAEITDSVSRKENIRKATELTMNFEFEQKMNTAEAIQDAKDEITRTRQVAMTIGLVLSILLIVGALLGYLGKKKANGILLSQKKEVEATLNKLKDTQAQLIQSEKMASLGELTAGIAHEIQNPLNFVNNFSEVSEELIGEIEEERAKTQESRDEGLVSSILGELKENLIKINHHGKRAGSIVRGMLEHSRTHSGEKVATDLNQLADECLRLSFHGLRAKDKSFQAEFRTDFDPKLPKVNVVSQDMGRALLNIINNAFYACTKAPPFPLPSASAYGQKAPLVIVASKHLGDTVQISISDNGFGIPEGIKNKIFQPFFTTKPTGEGTGLGLSLSYDIVKAHGGELTVDSKVGEGTKFTLSMAITKESAVKHDNTASQFA